ncbi:MAG: squalene synthase HpnC [Proteobacteria bacterium CG1_02_64_396]|nr:MAG: squalene synthase HpnC [Proteobacteria bacterium CG1_02_64_396]
MARSHYENFPVASPLIPARLRPHVAAVYAFARCADDVADESPLPASQKTALLGALAEAVRLQTPLPPPWDELLPGARWFLPPLMDTARRFAIDETLLTDLLDAFAQDVVRARYDQWEDLLDYSRRSANPVGRLVLRLFGQDTPENLAASDLLCTGLQLANFWQDIALDLRDRDRIYIPAAIAAEHGVDLEHLLGGQNGQKNLQNLVAGLVRRTTPLFLESWPLVGRLKGRLKLEIAATWWGGASILQGLADTGFQPWVQRPSLSKADLLKGWRPILFPPRHPPLLSRAD